MTENKRLTLGLIPFLNCVPFFACLKENGFDGDLVSGVPSALNRMLQNGSVDVSPSSSFEYARNWNDYQILPEHSISSTGAVKSVLLFSPFELAELEGQTVFITGESATSINLLRVLLREFCHLEKTQDKVPDEPIETLIRQKKPALLIGDRALRMAENPPEGIRVFDLGALWTEFTGLPFVFALWIVRKEALNSGTQILKELGGQLMASRSYVLEHPETFAQASAEQTGFNVKMITAYWQTINYDFDEKHQQGLKLFFSLCVKHGLLKQDPQLSFLAD